MELLMPNIIHKSEMVERMRILKRELEIQGIEKYNLWEGIYDKESTFAGINKAHKQIVQYAKNNNLPKVLIFEDDIKFLGFGAFDYYLNHEPNDYDIYLGGIYLGIIKDNIVKEFTALHCYIVHEKFYDIFLNTDNEKHLDHALSRVGKYVVCDKMIAVQHNGWSDNSKAYCNYDVLLQNRELYCNV